MLEKMGKMGQMEIQDLKDLLDQKICGIHITLLYQEENIMLMVLKEIQFTYTEIIDIDLL